VILLNKNVKVINYYLKGNIVNPSDLVIKEKIVYELIKKHIKESNK